MRRFWSRVDKFSVLIAGIVIGTIITNLIWIFRS
jgi:hypothetical protein